MNPTISPSFWHDPDLEESPPEIKLTWLWMITNPDTSLCGVFRKSGRRFEFQTGLPAVWLEKTLAAFPSKFVVQDDKVLLKSYIKFQYGTGEALGRNNLAKPLRRAIDTLPPLFRESILTLHPELKPLPSPCQTLSDPAKHSQNTRDQSLDHPHPPPQEPKPLPSPCQGPEKRREEKRREERGECEGEPIIPTEAEVIAYGRGGVGIPDEYCSRYWTTKQVRPGLWFYRNGSGIKLIDWRREILARWIADRATWRKEMFVTRPAPATTPLLAEILQLKAELQCETDIKKRRELAAKIEEMEK